MRSKKVLLSLVFIIIMALLSSGCLFSSKPVIGAISDQIGKVGQEFTYQVVAYDPDSGELTYSLSGEPEGMQIGNSTGLITWTPGESQIGTFTIEVKVSNGNSFSVKQFNITIEIIYLTSIEVSPSTMSIYVGNSNNITLVTAYYDNGNSTELAFTDCDYSSDNVSVATVNNSGVITGVSAGTTTITVSYTEEGITKTDTVEVTVSQAPKVLTSIDVSPMTMQILVGNSNTIISITANYNIGGSAELALTDCDYSSDNPNIATVSGSGVITGVSAGTAVITVIYTEGGITKTDIVEVTVSEPPKVLTSISVLPFNMSVYVGSSKNITSITAHYNDESTTAIGLDSASYGSNHTNIASVNTTGKVTGVSAGTAVITVTYTEGGITKTDTVEVTVSEPPKVLTSINVLPSTMTIRRGQSDTIDSITAYYSNGDSKELAPTDCDYDSNKVNVSVTDGVISVSSTCQATTAIITVTYTEGSVTKEDYVTVTVPGG